MATFNITKPNTLLMKSLPWCSFEVSTFQRSLAFAACSAVRSTIQAKNRKEYTFANDHALQELGLDLFNEEFDVHNDGSYARELLGFEEQIADTSDRYVYLIAAAVVGVFGPNWRAIYTSIESGSSPRTDAIAVTWAELARQIPEFANSLPASRAITDLGNMAIQDKADTLAELDFYSEQARKNPDMLSQLSQEQEFDLLARYVNHLERVRSRLLQRTLQSGSGRYFAYLQNKEELERFMQHYAETLRLHISF